MSTTEASLALVLCRSAWVLDAVLNGEAAPVALMRINTHKTIHIHGAVRDVVYRSLRYLGTSEALLAVLLQRQPSAKIKTLLLCAFALLIDDEDQAAYAYFTIVNQAVEAVFIETKSSAVKGMVNAVLRRFLRQKNILLAQIMESDSVAQWNYPEWWIKAVTAAYPDDWKTILAFGNERPPMILRVNVQRISPEAYLARLNDLGYEANLVGPSAIHLIQAIAVEKIPGFSSGEISVQDASAQLAAPLLDIKPGMRVLDACAAPGGKTCHLLELADVDLTALELNAQRALRIQQNLQRLDLHAHVQIGDAGLPSTWWNGNPFDRILADAPCSASGIVRRHSDIRWLRKPTEIKNLVEQQRRILQALWETLVVGGQLLYTTCSIFPEEGELQAQWFEQVTQNAVRLDAPGQILPSQFHDGFFYARFLKR